MIPSIIHLLKTGDIQCVKVRTVGGKSIIPLFLECRADRERGNSSNSSSVVDDDLETC